MAINKLDTVAWSKDRFDEIVAKLGPFLKQAGFRDSDVTYVPCSGLAGENLVKTSQQSQLTNWYDGPSLLQVIGMQINILSEGVARGDRGSLLIFSKILQM